MMPAEVAEYAVPVLLAITAHEAAHGYAAHLLGDRTAKDAGRLTLNPIPHSDPVGTVLVPALLLLASGGKVVFGWALPLPVNYSALRARWCVAVISAAGPLANAAMLAVWWALGPLGLGTAADVGVRVNLLFCLCNLLPVLPLDGGRILWALLPPRAAVRYSLLEPYGYWVVLAVLLLILF